MKKGAMIFVSLLLASLVAARTFVWDYEPTAISHEGRLFESLSSPTILHPFGTTSLSQDVFVRVVDGTIIALVVLLLGSAASALFGIFLAWLSFLGGRWIDKFVSLTADALYSIPSILIALALMIGVPSSTVSREWIVISTTVIAVMLFFGSKLFRTLRTNLAREQQSGYFAAALAIDLPKNTLFFRHLLPNSLTGLRPLITGAGSDSILTLAGLGFIGVGISATDGADWGYDLSRGIQDLSQGIWWTTLFPALAISSLVLSFSRFLERDRGA